MKKLIIEARVNEYAMRDENPNVPWSPAEIGEAAAEVEAAGGQRVGEHENGPIRWVVMADPEGNEFCVERSAAERAATG